MLARQTLVDCASILLVQIAEFRLSFVDRRREAVEHRRHGRSSLRTWLSTVCLSDFDLFEALQGIAVLPQRSAWAFAAAAAACESRPMLAIIGCSRCRPACTAASHCWKAAKCFS